MIIEEFMARMESRDLQKVILVPLQDLSWASSPATHMKKLLEFEYLWKLLLEKAPNGVVAPAATKQGIEACNAQGLINFTKQTSANFADKVSSTIRMGLSKFRDVRDSAKMLQATERKLGSSANIKKLQSILDMMSERTTIKGSEPGPKARAMLVEASTCHYLTENSFPVTRRISGERVSDSTLNLIL